MLLHLVKVPLNSSTALWCINRSSKFYTIFKPAEGALFPLTQVSNEEVKQYWPLHQPLGYTTFPVATCESRCGDPSLASWLEARLGAVDGRF